MAVTYTDVFGSLQAVVAGNQGLSSTSTSTTNATGLGTVNAPLSSLYLQTDSNSDGLHIISNATGAINGRTFYIARLDAAPNVLQINVDASGQCVIGTTTQNWVTVDGPTGKLTAAGALSVAGAATLMSSLTAAGNITAANIVGAAISGSGQLNITGQDSYARSIQSLVANATTNQLVLGSGLSNGNSAILSWTPNKVTMGLYGGSTIAIDNNGNVTIPGNLTVGGTSNVTSPPNLTVTTLAVTGQNSSNAGNTFLTSGANYNTIYLGASNATNQSAFMTWAPSKLTLGLYGGQPISIDNSGDTVVPGQLQVTGYDSYGRSIQSMIPTATSNTWLLGSVFSTGNCAVFTWSANKLAFSIYGGPLVTIDTNGNLVVPGNLNVAGYDANNRSIQSLISGATSNYWQFGSAASTGNCNVFQWTPNSLAFALYGCPACSLDNNGNFKVPGNLTTGGTYAPSNINCPGTLDLPNAAYSLSLYSSNYTGSGQSNTGNGIIAIATPSGQSQAFGWIGGGWAATGSNQIGSAFSNFPTNLTQYSGSLSPSANVGQPGQPYVFQVPASGIWSFSFMTLLDAATINSTTQSTSIYLIPLVGSNGTNGNMMYNINQRCGSVQLPTSGLPATATWTGYCATGTMMCPVVLLTNSSNSSGSSDSAHSCYCGGFCSSSFVATLLSLH